MGNSYTERLDRETARLLVLWALELYGPKKLGISRAYAYQLRTGKRKPSHELAIKTLETLTAKDLLQLIWLLGEYHGKKWARRLAWVRTPPLHGGGPGFKSPRAHQTLSLS